MQVDISIFDRIRQSISVVLAGVNANEAATVWVGKLPQQFVSGDVYAAAQKVRGLFQDHGTVSAVTVRRSHALNSVDACMHLECGSSAGHLLLVTCCDLCRCGRSRHRWGAGRWSPSQTASWHSGPCMPRSWWRARRRHWSVHGCLRTLVHLCM